MHKLNKIRLELDYNINNNLGGKKFQTVKYLSMHDMPVDSTIYLSAI